MWQLGLRYYTIKLYFDYFFTELTQQFNALLRTHEVNYVTYNPIAPKLQELDAVQL